MAVVVGAAMVTTAAVGEVVVVGGHRRSSVESSPVRWLLRIMPLLFRIMRRPMHRHRPMGRGGGVTSRSLITPTHRLAPAGSEPFSRSETRPKLALTTFREVMLDELEDHYPIGRFILHRAPAVGMSRSDLVRRLGYRDIGSGVEALSATMLTGVITAQLADHLAGALEANDALVGSVIDATMRQKRDEARLDHPLWKLQDAISGKKRRLRVNEPTSPLSDHTCRSRQSARCLRRYSLPPY
jgi:hypothetical protein